MHRTLALSLSFLLLGAAGAQASGLAIPEDEVRILTFPKPVATVFVANPTVADVNMIDPTHAFVLGKAFGATNMIALDSQGLPVTTEHVTVLGSSHLVTLDRGSAQFTYACASARCEVSATPGDAKQYHDDTMSEIAMREDMGAKQATPNEGH